MISVAARHFGQPDGLTNYICHWSRTRNYVYVETPKVACTTVKRVLQAAELGRADHPLMPADVHDRGASPLLSPHDDPGAFLTALHDPSCFRFAFVRNPYARALSCWLDKFVGNEFENARLAPLLGFASGEVPDFADFLRAVAAQPEAGRDPHWATQSYLLRPDRIRYGFLGRFETFRTDFLRVCGHLGIGEHAGELSDTWHATRAAGKVASRVGALEGALIRQIYDADFRTFGYGWDPALV
ncbi:sulfotransferase family protein [Roseibacterium sp. SDUM158016]|uniref:sulfotransferase family protein n=1 Tax=Roseicyclus sediminis TaxID=2980997 RepID=UPI0021CE0682|nr:sulfotransferase family protein [Roseibacterium sp. SDUM158016]MCU4652177.1 sulfotransferase family protein [Roseibacterium sp. SDUM158016]